MININFETGKAEKRLGDMKKYAPTVISRALNRAIQNAKTNTNKETRKTYTLKSRDINETIKISKAGKSNLSANFISKGSNLGLEKYRISPTKPRPNNPPKTLKVTVKKGKKISYDGAFMADVKGIKVFRRVASSRLPIKRIAGPAVPQLIKNKTLTKTVRQEAMKTYNKRFNHEITRVLERGKK